jgi:hypothetical protein
MNVAAPPYLSSETVAGGQMVDRIFWMANLGVMVGIVVLGGVAMAYVAG